MPNRVLLKWNCADGRTIVVQRVKRSYVCYAVAAVDFDAPEQLAAGNLAECRAAYLTAVADDLLEKFI